MSVEPRREGCVTSAGGRKPKTGGARKGPDAQSALAWRRTRPPPPVPGRAPVSWISTRGGVGGRGGLHTMRHPLFRGRRLKAPRARRRRRSRRSPKFLRFEQRKTPASSRRPPHTQRLRPDSMCCPCRGGGAGQGKKKARAAGVGATRRNSARAALRSLCRPQAGPPPIAPQCMHRHDHHHVSTGERGRKTGRSAPLARYQPHYPLAFVFFRIWLTSVSGLPRVHKHCHSARSGNGSTHSALVQGRGSGEKGGGRLPRGRPLERKGGTRVRKNFRLIFFASSPFTRH